MGESLLDNVKLNFVSKNINSFTCIQLNIIFNLIILAIKWVFIGFYSVNVSHAPVLTFKSESNIGMFGFW